MDRLESALTGRYTIERELGRGGMATVYLARDEKHHRSVAIKVLRPEVASVVGTERFLREIDIAAGLNHPHIMPLFDSGGSGEAGGEAGGGGGEGGGGGGGGGGGELLYYVMPFVEGETLSDRLAREGELPIRTTLRILRDVVDALAAAHRQGVIHRDIKPDNVMLLENHAVVTDFGIAKAVSDATGAQTLTTTGMALGTPLYMAPEQAAGSSHVDHRADIYAVGAMAYEMLTGRPPFTGVTPQAVMAAHVSETPQPVSERRASVPPLLADAVMRCLAKKPADRWQSADELLFQLEALTTPGETMTPTAGTPTGAKRGRRVAVAAALVVGAGVAVAGWWLTHRSPPTFVFGRSVQVTAQPGLEIQPALSPDGRFVAYAAGGSAHMQIYIRTIGGGRTIPLSNDSADVAFQPRWSPDGNQILYLTRGGVRVAPALGGSSRPVVGPSASRIVVAAAWSPDGKQIVFVRRDSVLAAPVAGGSARLLAAVPGPHSCSWSPAGRWIACTTGNQNAVLPGNTFGNRAPSAIVLIPAAGGRARPITGRENLNESPVWSPDGRRLFYISSRDGPRDVYAQEITSDGRSKGAPVRVTTGLNAQSLSISGTGTRFAYDVYSARSNIWALPIPAHGPVDAGGATQLTRGSQVIEATRPSPDDNWLLYDSDLRGSSNIFRIPIGGGAPEQLTSDSFDEFAPSLSPDGRLLAYHSFRSRTRDIEVRPLDGGPVVRATDSPGQESYPVWSPDGRRLVFVDQGEALAVLVSTSLGPGHWSPPDTIGHGIEAQWSPDGREVAYVGIDSTAPGPTLAVFEVPLSSGAPRVVYRDTATSSHINLRSYPWGLFWAPDGRLCLKTHDAQGRAYIWQIVEGESLRLLVRFPNLDRPSNRADFSADRRRFYFTFEDRESDVFVADVTRQ